MDQKQMMKQVLDFNKGIFDNAFNTISSIQDETEKLLERYMEKSNLMTPDGKKSMDTIVDSYRQRRNDFKLMADESYRRASEYFIPTEKKQ